MINHQKQVRLTTSLAVFLIKIASFFAGIFVSIINFPASFSFSYFFVTTPTLIEIAFYYFLIISGVNVLDMLKPLPINNSL